MPLPSFKFICTYDFSFLNAQWETYANMLAIDPSIFVSPRRCPCHLSSRFMATWSPTLRLPLGAFYTPAISSTPGWLPLSTSRPSWQTLTPRPPMTAQSSMLRMVCHIDYWRMAPWFKLNFNSSLYLVYSPCLCNYFNFTLGYLGVTT